MTQNTEELASDDENALAEDTRKVIATHYPAPDANEQELLPHTLTMIVRDRAGTLARIVGLFSARSYNINSISASNIDPERGLSSITLTTHGSDKVLKQICNQLERLVNVYCVSDVSGSKDRVVREMVLIKVRAEGEKRLEALTIANSFHANIVDAAQNAVIIEMSGAPQKVNSFIELLRPLGVIDVVKSGPAGMINSNNSFMERIVEEEMDD